MGYKVKCAFALCALLVLTATCAHAADVDRQTWFNSMTDFFATAGKSDKDKAEIRRLRKKMRRDYRQQNERIKKQSRSQKEIKAQQQKIKDKYNTGKTRIGL